MSIGLDFAIGGWVFLAVVGAIFVLVLLFVRSMMLILFMLMVFIVALVIAGFLSLSYFL